MNLDMLAGAELDYWVARAEGYRADIFELYGRQCCRVDVLDTGWGMYEPTENSKLIGDILFKRKYTLYPHPMNDGQGVLKTIWLAEAQMNRHFHGMYTDEQPRVAICRLRVAEAIADGDLRPPFVVQRSGAKLCQK